MRLFCITREMVWLLLEVDLLHMGSIQFQFMMGMEAVMMGVLFICKPTKSHVAPTRMATTHRSFHCRKYMEKTTDLNNRSRCRDSYSSTGGISHAGPLSSMNSKQCILLSIFSDLQRYMLPNISSRVNHKITKTFGSTIIYATKYMV